MKNLKITENDFRPNWMELPRISLSMASTKTFHYKRCIISTELIDIEYKTDKIGRERRELILYNRYKNVKVDAHVDMDEVELDKWHDTFDVAKEFGRVKIEIVGTPYWCPYHRIVKIKKSKITSMTNF